MRQPPDGVAPVPVAQSVASHNEALERLSQQLGQLSDRLSSLEVPLLPEAASAAEQAVKPLAEAEEGLRSETSAQRVSRWGEPPPSGVMDFDYCFVFPLPNYFKSLEAEAQDAEPGSEKAVELKRLAEEARKEAEDSEKELRGKLDARTQYHAKARGKEISPADMEFSNQVQVLLKDLFFEADMAEDFECWNINNYEGVRAGCIDLLMTFFRRAEEPYYSYAFTSVDQDELILCVKMLEQTSLKHAIRSNYPMRLDMKAVEDEKRLNIRLADGPAGPTGAAMCPALVPPDEKVMELFQKYPCEANEEYQTYIRKVDSIRLLYDRVTDILDLDFMVKWGFMKVAFPLHSKQRLEYLKRVWANPRRWWSFDQKVEDIREYFGETVTLYFVFTQHICQYTCVFALFNCVIMLADLLHGFDREDILGSIGGVYAPDWTRIVSIFFVVIWANVFTVHLERKFRKLSAIWGSSYGNESEVKSFPNPRFAMMAHMGPSDVDENVHEFTVPYDTRRIGRVKSLSGTALFIAFTLLCSGMLLRVKAHFLALGYHSASLFASYAVTVQIKVCAAVWGWLCKILTDYEYHKEQGDYDASVAFKSFYVQLINLFCSFVYVAFFMEAWGDKSYQAYGSTPWPYLTFQMITTFGLYLAFSLYDLVSPMLTLYKSTREEMQKLKKCGRMQKHETEMPYSYIELQTKMEAYTGDDENSDYLDIVGVFGFVAGFGVTFPLGSVFALVYLLLQMRVDAWKLTRVMQRPWPLLCKEDWKWASIANQLMFLCITTNIAFMVVYLEPFRSMDAANQAVSFFLFMTANFVFSGVLMLLIPPISQDVELAGRRRRRQIYQVDCYKKRVAGRSEEGQEDKFKLLCRGDSSFLHIPRLQRRLSGQLFEAPKF